MVVKLLWWQVTFCGRNNIEKARGPFLMFNSCIYNLKGVRTMERTYVDFTGEYYDNLDKLLDLGEGTNIRVYDPKKWIRENVILIQE